MQAKAVKNSPINLSAPRRTATIQPKLMVNTPGDRYEQEADAMADRVMRMPESKPQSLKPTSTGLIARSIQRKCAACEAEEENKKKLMRKAEGGGGGFAASPGLVSQLSATRGGGSPLPERTRSFMENAFSTDFSGVRVHADGQAADMSRSIQAKAFTYGSDIYFNSGQFVPESDGGKRLLAHELGHVVQQGGGNPSPSIQKWDAPEAKEDWPLTYQLRHYLYYTELNKSIDIIRRLSHKEKDEVLASWDHRERATREFSGDEFGDKSVYELILAFTENGYRNLYGCLDWLLYEFEENSGWSWIEYIISIHNEEERRKILFDDDMKSRFSSTYGDFEFYLLLKDYLAGIDLYKSLDWMFFEAELGEIYRERMRDVILKHPKEQMKVVREDGAMKELFILHLTDFGVAMIVQALELPLREQLEWMISEDTNYYLIFDAFEKAYAKDPDEAEKVRKDKSMMEVLRKEIGSHQSDLLESFLGTMGMPDLSDQEVDAKFIRDNEELIKQHFKVQDLKLEAAYNDDFLKSKERGVDTESKKLDEMRQQVGTTDLEIGKRIERFIAAFYRNALKLALQMLAMSEQEIVKEGEELGVTSRRDDGFENLWQALQPVRDLRVEFVDRVREIKGSGLGSGIDVLDSLWDYGVTHTHQLEFFRLYHEFEGKYKALKTKEDNKLVKLFPVMADEELTLRRVWTNDKEELKSAVGGTVRDRYSDVQDARKNIAEEPGVIWELDKLIAMAKDMYGVKDGSAYEMIIDRKVEEETSSVWDALLTVLAIAFAILSFVPGLNAIGLVGGAIVGGISAGRGIADYAHKKPMSGTDFDRQKALASEPSLFWVVLDIAFFAADIIAVAKLAKAVKPFMKTSAAAKASKGEVLEGLKRNIPEINPRNLKEGISPDDASKMLADSYAKEATNMAKGADDVVEDAASASRNLDSARGKNQFRDMTGAEIDAELGQVRQNRPSKIKENSEHFSKYDYEVEANGHVYRRRKDGKGWCRFSNKDCELSAEAQSKLKQYEQDNSFPRQVDPDVEANWDLLEGIEDVLVGGTGWKQHQRAVLKRLKDLYGDVGDEVKVKVTLSNEKTAIIVPDALVELPNGSFRIVDAKHQQDALIAVGKKKIAETLNGNQPEVFPEIASGKILRAELVDNTAAKIGRTPGSQIQLDKTIEIHTNNELGGIEVMIYKP